MHAEAPHAAFSYLGLAGCFPVALASADEVSWRICALGEHPSWHADRITLSQGTLSHNGGPSARGLRVTLCGIAWTQHEVFGRGNLAELLSLQRWLDEASSVQARLAALNGDFLLSYVPPDATQCWLYRNVTGMRALYYRRTVHGLCWSTVIDDLFTPSGPALSDVDVTMLPLLVTAALPDPARTPYRDVLRLPAGHGLHLTPEQTIRPFAHDFAVPDHRRLSLADAAERFHFYLSQAFQRKLGHFSRIGVLLSGGLDSAIAAKEAMQVAPTVHGLHWAWPSLPILDDERVCAQAIAQQLGIELTCIDGSADLAAGGAYLRCLQGLSLPFTQSFFSSFLASAHAAAQGQLPVVIGGHLGDLLFAGAQKDGFRAQLFPPHPINVLRTAGKLLCWYTRKQAFAVLWQLLLHPQRFTPEPLGPRIESCQAWLVPAAYQRVREQGNYVYPQIAPSASTQMTYHHLKESINSSTDTDTNLVYHAFFPQRVLLLHPYADRTLLEFCLGLAPLHREGFAAGVRISKVVARFAYLYDLPSSIIGRDVRFPYAAVEQAYGVHNRRELLALLGEESCLADLGILNAEQIATLATDSHEFRRHYGTFSIAASVELWLRHLDGRPALPPPVAPRAASCTVLGTQAAQDMHARYGPLSIPVDVVVTAVSGTLVLLNTLTQEVIHLDEEASRVLARLCEASVGQALLQALGPWEQEESGLDEEAISALLHALHNEGWILFRSGEAVQKEEVV